jgi:hypothetical protein
MWMYQDVPFNNTDVIQHNREKMDEQVIQIVKQYNVNKRFKKN